MFCIIQVTLFRALYRSYTTTFHGTYIVDNKEEIPEDKIGEKIPDNISVDTYVTWFISMTMDLFRNFHRPFSPFSNHYFCNVH